MSNLAYGICTLYTYKNLQKAHQLAPFVGRREVAGYENHPRFPAVAGVSDKGYYFGGWRARTGDLEVW